MQGSAAILSWLARPGETGALLFSAGSDPEQPWARVAGLPFSQTDTCICLRRPRHRASETESPPNRPFPKDLKRGPQEWD